MNRFQLESAAAALSSSSVKTQSTKVRDPDHTGLPPHAIFAPLHYERNYAYPLVVWLHGPGDDERQLQRVMPLVSTRNYVGIGPRGTASETNSRGYFWRQTSGDIAVAHQRVMDCVNIASRRFNVAQNRIFLGGYQCGGTMAFRIGLQYPERFAGILSIGGPFPNTLTPLFNLRQARQLPLFIAQGRADQAYTAEQTCDELRLFHAGGFAVTLRQYPCADELTTQMLHDMDVWMMQLVTGNIMPEDDQQSLSDIN